MPQVRLEYTDKLRPAKAIESILSDIHQIIHLETGIAIEYCKSRAFRVTDYCIGDDPGQGQFIHLEIGLFAGRGAALKKKIGEQTLQLLEAEFVRADPAKGKLQITVEFRDMEKAGYFKITRESGD